MIDVIAKNGENKIAAKDLPTKILIMIFSEYPEGVSVGKIKDILHEVEQKAEDITMIPDLDS